VRQLSVFLDNRVGTFLSLVRLLKENHIELLGVSVLEATEITLLRMVLSDPESAQTVFMERGIPHTDAPLVVVELRETSHDLSHALSVLLAAEINIRSSYPLLTRPNDYPLLALHVDDVEIGAEALSNAGFKVLSQGELSR
jgi:hypothetical protein